jgi:hypothetical protein
MADEPRSCEVRDQRVRCQASGCVLPS